MFAYIFLPVVWFFVARSFGIPITFKESVVSWYVSSIGRYIPGKVWQFAGRVSSLNHPAGKVLSAMFYEHLVLMLSAAMFSFIYPKYPFIQGLAFSILLFITIIWGYFVKFLQRFNPNLSYAPKNAKFVFISLFISVIYWIFSSLSAYFVSLSLSSNYGYRYIAFVFSFSFVASYVLPLTPAGLGVREGIISALMGYNIQSSAFSILTRLVITTVDIVMLIFALIYNRFAK